MESCLCTNHAGLFSFETSCNKEYVMLTSCTLCPRTCKVNREIGEIGYCKMPAQIYAARAALHFWEEPSISGNKGSGTVFFSGCNLRCAFCQNHEIAIGKTGKEISVSRLSEIYLELQEQGAHNINLVTPTHYVLSIIESLRLAKEQGLSIPIVYNSGGYESKETLKRLDGLIDIYLPDSKYYSSTLATAYSNAPDYPEVNLAALKEMFRQVGPCKFDQNSMLQRGMIIRHLILPGETADSKRVLRRLYETFGNDVYLSIMNQYTPLPHISHIPALCRRVSDEEYRRVLTFCQRLGIQHAYIQEGETASESFIPPFTLEGL